MSPHLPFKPVFLQNGLYFSFKYQENASDHVPFVEAFEYSVALPQKVHVLYGIEHSISSHVKGFSFNVIYWF